MNTSPSMKSNGQSLFERMHRLRSIFVGQTVLVSTRAKLVLFMFLLFMATFSLERFVLYFSSANEFAGIHSCEIARAFVFGFRFDLVITCMFLVPLVVIVVFIPRIDDRHKYGAILVSLYCGLASAVVFFSSIADYYFFREFGERLNHKVFDYISSDYVYRIIRSQYPYISASIVTLGVFVALSWLVYRYLLSKRYRRGDVTGSTVWLLLVLIPLGIGIRGSLGPKPINSGPAYFSHSNRLAQLTLNGLFTLREAGTSIFARSITLGERFKLLPVEEALSVTKRLLQTPQDHFPNRVENPIWRRTDTGKPRANYNVVLIIMESLAWPYIDPMGGLSDLTPNLNNLIKHGVFMDHCFSVGHRTTYAFSGVVCGYPDLPGESITTRERSVGNFLTLGSVLSRRGYKTMFIYGGQPHYDHRQAFLGSNGFNELIFGDQFPQKTFKTHLGWCDEDLFAAAHKTFQEEEGPFFAVLLTLAFHRDYQIPKGKVDADSRGHSHQKQRSAIKYTDWSIGQYMKKAQQSDYFNETLFVFIADHSGGFLNQEPDPSAFRVPFLVYAPSILGNQGKRISQVCSQTDVAPTIMSLLGGSYSHSFFGSSVLDREANKGRALIEPGDGTLAYVEGADNLVVIPPHSSHSTLFYFQYPDTLVELDAKVPRNRQTLRRLQKEAIAMLQTAESLYQKGSYQYP